MLVMWGATGVINWNNERAEAGTTLLTISRLRIDGTEFFAFGSETFVRITGLLCEAEGLYPRYARCVAVHKTIGMTVKVLYAFLLTRPPANARCRQTGFLFH